MERVRAKVATTVEFLFVGTVLAAVFLFSFRPNWDIDIFWHVATGRWILENGRLPSTDIFSATDPSRPWTPFQWLYEVLVYEVEARAGFLWIRLLHAGLFVGAFGLWWLSFRRALGRRIPAALLLLLALVLSGDRFRVRPEAFNFLFTAVALPVLLGYGDRGGRPRAWVLAGIAVAGALWANLHGGGALWLPLSATALAAGRTLRWLADPGDREARARAAGAAWLTAAAGLPMLVMPGFVKGVIHASAMVEGSMALIPEWHPPAAYFDPAMGGRLTPAHAVCGLFPYLLLAALALIVAWGMVRKGWRDFARSGDMGLLALSGLMALMAAQTARFIYLDAVAVAALAAAFPGRVTAAFAGRGAQIAALLASLLLGALSFDQSILKDRRGLGNALKSLSSDLEPGTFPVEAADAVSAMGLKGRVFHFTSWGGYLVGRLFPDCSIFTDGRGNFSAAEREVLLQTHKPYQREEALEAAWQQFPFEIVVFPAPVFPLLDWDRSRWTLVHRDDQAEVFLRVSPANGENLARVRAWWRALGMGVPDDVAGAEGTYLRAVSELRLRRKDVQAALAAAEDKARSASPRTAASGLFEGAHVLFESGRYHTAARFFRMALDPGFRHSTTGLYLAWSLYLDGNPDGARQALRDHVLDPALAGRPDLGPLKYGGQRILEQLVARLGVRGP